MVEAMLARRTVLRAGAALAATGAAPAVVLAQTAAKPKFEFGVRDIVYRVIDGKPRKARVYQPEGDGPFPLVLFIHGGAWVDKDRTDDQNALIDFANDGVAVVAIEFRSGNEAPYPASLADINYGIRWLKAHAGEFGSAANRVGIYGTSSGGHQVLLSAMRPDDPRYAAQKLDEAPDMNAKLAFVVSGWGVLYPLVRTNIGREKGIQSVVKAATTFFHDDDTMNEATPALILDRGEKAFLPPAFVFQGTADQWTTPELAERLQKDWRDKGGEMELLLIEGAKHTFVTEHPFEKGSIKAMKAATAFIKKHGGGAA